MAQVGEFVQADVVGDIFGRADEPPVEADAGGVAANAPEGFGVGKGMALGVRWVVRIWPSRRGSRYSRARSCRKQRKWVSWAAVSFRATEFRRPDLDVVCCVDGQGRLNALIPNPFGKRVCRCLPSRCFV